MDRRLFKIKPYKYGEQPKCELNLKLNTNENSYHPNLSIIKEIIKEIKFFGNILKFYPDSDSNLFKNEISKFYNLNKNKIFISNGSDDALSNIFITFFKNKKILYIIDLTYSFYESFIKLYKIKYKIIKLNKNFSINLKNIKKKNNNIIINNPNAPTGKFIKNIEIKIISKNTKSIIVIDETYIDFENQTILKNINKYKNIIIVQTLSKSRSLAGLRVGFVIAEEKLIKKMNETKNCLNSYPVNIISQKSILKMFKNNVFFEKIKNLNKKNKSFLIKGLKENNFKIINSETNFILTTNRKININKLNKILIKKNIFIRKFEIPKIENFVRISVGKKLECEILIKKIKKILNNFK
ncbi:MAG: aminotransferase class I/II-fold pyridoxal phosphate-dependent enzyme [Candidatus Nasuia deltocephalinicola]